MSLGPKILLPGRRQQMQDRAWSRLGSPLGKQMRQSLIRRVWKGDVKYARKLTNSRTVVVLDYEGRELVFLYSSAHKEIISFLPPDAPETAEWRGGQSAATTGPARRRREGVHR
jgi:hypothetical protein